MIAKVSDKMRGRIAAFAHETLDMAGVARIDAKVGQAMAAPAALEALFAHVAALEAVAEAAERAPHAFNCDILIRMLRPESESAPTCACGRADIDAALADLRMEGAQTG